MAACGYAAGVKVFTFMEKISEKQERERKPDVNSLCYESEYSKEKEAGVG